MQTYRITIVNDANGVVGDYTERASRLGVAVDRAVTEYADSRFGSRGTMIPAARNQTLRITVQRVD